MLVNVASYAVVSEAERGGSGSCIVRTVDVKHLWRSVFVNPELQHRHGRVVVDVPYAERQLMLAVGQ